MKQLNKIKETAHQMMLLQTQIAKLAGDLQTDPYNQDIIEALFELPGNMAPMLHEQVLAFQDLAKELNSED